MTSIDEIVAGLIRFEVERALAGKEVTREVVVVDPRRLYSVASVAELLEVSKGWVYERIRDGRMAVVELGDEKTKQRVSAVELQRFIDSRTFGG